MMIVPGAGSETLLMSAVMPVFWPLQVAPAFVVVRIVPKLPTAYPTPPENPMSLMEFPCGVGVPHSQPLWPFATCAVADGARKAIAARPARTGNNALLPTLSPFPSCFLSTHAGRDATLTGTARGKLRVFRASLRSDLVHRAFARDV